MIRNTIDFNVNTFTSPRRPTTLTNHMDADHWSPVPPAALADRISSLHLTDQRDGLAQVGDPSPASEKTADKLLSPPIASQAHNGERLEQSVAPAGELHTFPTELGGRPIAPQSLSWKGFVSHYGCEAGVAPLSFPRSIYSVLSRPGWPVWDSKLQRDRILWLGRVATYLLRRALGSRDMHTLTRPAVLLGAIADSVMET